MGEPTPAKQQESINFRGDGKKYPYLPLALEGLGIHHMQEYVDRPKGISCFQWVQCVAGSGVILLDGAEYQVLPGQGIYLPADYPHVYFGVDQPWITNFICFTGSTVEAMLESLGIQKPGVYTIEEPSRILEIETEIYRLCQNTDLSQERKISGCLYNLLLELSFVFRKNTSGGYAGMHEKVHKAVCYMQDNYMKQVSLEDIAEAAGLSREYLCQLFKKQTGFTVLDYLMQIRMAAAKGELMVQRNSTLEEIAHLCGFESASYFCAVFKREEKMTPGQFREFRRNKKDLS